MPRSSRILILAQVPPPTHGQSVMVGHLVQRAGEGPAGHFLHINLRLSRDELDVGTLRPLKLLFLGWYAFRAVWACSFQGARDVYYVPAPGKRGAIIRDVLLLGLLKPFTRHLILHWHAVGLGAYLQQHPQDPWGKRLARLLDQHRLSICLSRKAAEDVQLLKPERIAVVPNGVPDPASDFPALLKKRQDRLAERREALADPASPLVEVRLLYVGLCIRSKGIFEALSTAAALANQWNRPHPACKICLTIAGPFPSDLELREFKEATARALENLPPHAQSRLAVELTGFVDQRIKAELFESADLFIFPTRYENEGLPLTLLEAMAVGLPVLTTPWRSIPEALPGAYPWMTADPLALPELAAGALLADCFTELREWFLSRFTLKAHLDKLMTELGNP